jgi:xylan 1,4-beta-xylosidase
MRFLPLVLFASAAAAQDEVTIRVDAARRAGPMKPITSYFGYDEPNYTYMRNGQKLVRELAALRTDTPVYIRAHHLLVTGDGTPALKWGSTNAFTEDAAGKPAYDWRILDRIFDTYVNARAKPFVEIGFMPEALSTHPQPYTRHWPKPDDGKGWSYPPKDYSKWAELIRQWVLHSIERYGRSEVASWYWEVWNEPDISYWRGTPEEYDQLYDYAVDAVKRALPDARVGGPATTGPANPRAAAFLKQFLEHCARGRNYATGKTGAPLDFITYHAKGAPKVVESRVRMGIAKNLRDVAKGFEIVASFPQFQKLPIILSESDPEGCAACSARTYPQNAYRNGPLYASYTAVVLKGIVQLADQYKTNIEGMLTWAFEFEDQPYFDGFRTLATNGIDKPILNLFRMAAMLRGERVQVESSGAVPLDAILTAGVGAMPDIDALAVRGSTDVTVLAWNYHDDDVPGPDATVRLTITDLPESVSGFRLEHYRIDGSHSNAYTVWKDLGSPPHPTPEQYARLESAGKLERLESTRSVANRSGTVELTFKLPRQAVSLVKLVGRVP